MDIQTLLICNAAHLLLYFFVLVLITAFTPIAGMRWFAASYGFLALGDALVAGRGFLPDFLSIVVGNLSVFIAFVLQHKGSLVFVRGGTKHFRLQIGFLPIVAFGLVYFTYVHPSIVSRILLISVVLSVMSALSASILIPGSKGILSRQVLAGMALGFCVVNLLRGILTYILGSPENFLRPNRFQAFSLLCSDLLVCAALLCLHWMMNARLQEELVQAARIDSLTGLLNRRAMDSILASKVGVDAPEGSSFVLLLLDIDHFKLINDSWGHPTGDLVLRTVSETLSRELKGLGQASRWGGEEFCCLLESGDWNQGIEVAEKLRSSLEAMRIHVSPGNIFGITVSIGLTTSLKSDTTSGLLQRADEALYRAKRTGRNRVCFSEEIYPSSQPGNYLPSEVPSEI